MKAYVRDGGWVVIDDAGREFDVTRLTTTGQEGDYCACGGVWELRATADRRCAHIDAVEAAVVDYWATRMATHQARR